MSEYHPDVYEVLTLLESGRKWRSEIPARLKRAVGKVIGDGLAESLAVLIRADTGKPDWLLWMSDKGQGALLDSPPVETPLPDGTPVAEKDVPPLYREGGKPDGDRR
jgi:hypothetical protein